MTTFKDRHGTPIVVESDKTVVYHGEELTDEQADQLAQETIAEIRKRNLIPGRKSLSGGSKHSPSVQFRVSEDLWAQLDERAEEEGLSRSKLARKALESYLRSNRSA